MYTISKDDYFELYHLISEAKELMAVALEMPRTKATARLAEAMDLLDDVFKKDCEAYKAKMLAVIK